MQGALQTVEGFKDEIASSVLLYIIWKSYFLFLHTYILASIRGPKTNPQYNYSLRG